MACRAPSDDVNSIDRRPISVRPSVRPPTRGRTGVPRHSTLNIKCKEEEEEEEDG